jgi:hypothetical protein
MIGVDVLTAPPRNPDINHHSERDSYTMGIWLPSPDSAGLIRIEKPGTLWSRGLADEEQRMFLTEFESGLAPLGMNSRLQYIYPALGARLVYEEVAKDNTTTVQYSLTMPHPEQLNRAAAAIPNNLVTARFAESESGEQAFTVHDQLTQLKDGIFLMGTRGIFALHDLLTHSLGAYVLLDEQFLEQLASEAGHALRTNDEGTIKTFGRRLDQLIDCGNIGARVAEAMHFEQFAAEQAQCELDEVYEQESHSQVQWLYAASSLTSPLGGRTERETLTKTAKRFRSHCYALTAAASAIALS